MKKIFLLAFASLALGFGGCVEDNVYVGPPTVGNVSFSPEFPTNDNDVTVTATVNDNGGVESVTMKYTVNGGAEQSVAMTGTGSTYTGVIPRQDNNAQVTFHVTARNVKGLTADSPAVSFTVGAEPSIYLDLVMNEIDGVNKTIELYNKGLEPLVLNGCKLIKNEGGGSGGPGNAVWWTGTEAAGSIAPDQYILIGNTAAYQDTPFYGDAGISNGQNLKFELFDPDGVSVSVFTRGTPPWIQSSLNSVNPNSFQRIPNGTGDWLMAPPTNGATNAATGEAIPQT